MLHRALHGANREMHASKPYEDNRTTEILKKF